MSPLWLWSVYVYTFQYLVYSASYTQLWFDPCEGSWWWLRGSVLFGYKETSPGQCYDLNGRCHRLSGNAGIQRSTDISAIAGRPLRLSIYVDGNSLSTNARCTVSSEYDMDGVDFLWECVHPTKSCERTAHGFDGVEIIDLPPSTGKSTVKIILQMSADSTTDHCNFDNIQLSYLPATTLSPTSRPTFYPTRKPTSRPTSRPTFYPTKKQTFSPTKKKTSDPTKKQTSNPTEKPTSHPTKSTFQIPTNSPTKLPTKTSAVFPTKSITVHPTVAPGSAVTQNPTQSPTKRDHDHVSTELKDVHETKTDEAHASSSGEHNIAHSTSSETDKLYFMVGIIVCGICYFLFICLICNRIIFHKREFVKDMEMIAQEDKDEDTHAVTAKHRNKEKAHVLEKDDNEDEVALWLSILDLSQYYDVFMVDGFNSMDIIMDCMDKNTLKGMRITDIKHQKRIIEDLKRRKLAQRVTPQ